MEIQRHALVKRDYLVPFVLVTSLFFLWGFAHAILDVLNKHFQEVMDITRTHSAMVQVMFYLGYFIMAIPAGLFITKYGYRKGVVFGLLLYGIGSLMFIPGEYWMSFEFFLFSLFVIACGLVFLETAANPYMTELGDRETAASRLNLAQSFNGLGCICGPLVGGLLLFSGKGEANISYPYMLMGVVVLAVGFIFSRIKLPEIVHVDDLADGETVKRSLWSHKLFLFGIVALFSYEIAEISINSFFINYVVDDGWMNARDAAVVMLIGLAAKNAILIVEFAKDEVDKGRDIVESALHAASLRFRPILMTSLAFILGMLPMVIASGPGSASRQAIGTGVFFGMIVAVTVGILLVPFFFVMIYKATHKIKAKQ